MSKKISILRKSWALLQDTEKRGSYFLMGMMLIAMFLETLGVGMVIPALALLTREKADAQYDFLDSFSSLLGSPDHGTLVIIGMLILMAVYLIKGIFLAFLAWWQASFAYGIQKRLSQKLFTHYLDQPYTFHLQRNSSQLIRNIITEVSVFSSNIILPLLAIITEFLVVVGLATLLFMVEPVGASIVTIMLVSAAWGYYYITHAHILRWGELRQYHQGMRIQHLQQGLGGVKDIKLLGREAEFLDRFRAHNAENARMAQMQSIIQSIPKLWLEVLAVFGLAVLVIVLITQGRTIETIVPTLGVFGVTAFRLLPSINKVLTSIQAIKYGIPVVNMLTDEFRSEGHEGYAAETRPDISLQDRITIQNISYRYPSSDTLSLDNVSLVIRRGESIGLIGTSGAGKSTLVDIILGLLSPTTGTVSVDDTDIQRNLRSWQNRIGYVPQAIYLTDDSLASNIALGIPVTNINEDSMQHAIRAAQLEGFVDSLPDGLNTIVGERGVRLSGGQRQRIGIARALYHNPDVLVLDEATSSLDVHTESEVMSAVNALHGTKTIIIVAHRLSTVEYCDYKYKLEAGKVEDAIKQDINKKAI